MLEQRRRTNVGYFSGYLGWIILRDGDLCLVLALADLFSLQIA
jgi:hypothetical protein